MPGKKYNVRATPVKNQKNLKRHAHKTNAIRHGVTTDPARRAKQYSQINFDGTMHYAKTSNMKARENEFLKNFPTKNNVQKKSNAPAKPGYIYTFNGKIHK